MQWQNHKLTTWWLERFQEFPRFLTQAQRLGVQPRLSICLVCLFAAIAIAGVALAAETGTGQFRIGFSEKTFTDVEKNDAMAAVKVWADVIAGESDVDFIVIPRVMESVDEIAQALGTQEIDAVTLPTNEYWEIRDLLDPRTFIASDYDGHIFEEYVLLVHKDGGIARVENLRGRSLTFFQNIRTSLAPIWLDTILLKAGFPPAEAFCIVTTATKLAKAVLPVFFRQADACVVTRRGFNIMSELNPQVRQQLRVLASSPGLVPSGFCFRRDYNDPLRETVIAELGKMMTSPAGAQVMALFQNAGWQAFPISCLDSAFELLITYERLRSGTTAVNSNLVSVARGDTQGAAK